MALSLGAFYFMEQNKLPAAMLLGFLASLTRSVGFLIFIPFIILALQQLKQHNKTQALKLACNIDNCRFTVSSVEHCRILHNGFIPSAGYRPRFELGNLSTINQSILKLLCQSSINCPCRDFLYNRNSNNANPSCVFHYKDKICFQC